MKKILIIIIAIFFTGYSPPNTKSQYIIPGGARTACTSDIDNDMDLDIVTGHSVGWGYTNKSISVLENIDNGIFLVKDTSKSFCGNQKNIFTIHVNNDTFPDLVVFYSDFTYGTQRYIRVYYNEQGEFNNYSNFNLESDATFSGINHGKVNDDDYDDIVVISNNGHFWGILYNDGNGGFTSPEYFNVQGSYPTDVACGDLNGDGRDDVVVGGAKLEVYYSYNSGFIKDSIGYQEGLVQLADMDMDNDMDLVCLSGYFSTSIATIIENIGNGNFYTHEPFPYNPYCWRFVVSDLNNNSLPDIISSSVNNGVYILYNEGDYQFSAPVFIPVPLVGYDFVNAHCADLDNNGFNDLIITQTNAHFINLLFNDGNGNFVEDPITNITSISEPQTANLKCYPNPFIKETTIKINIDIQEIAELFVYDLSGKMVKKLTSKCTKGGTIKWDGLDNVGKPCKPGPYLLTLKVNGKILQTKKLIKY